MLGCLESSYSSHYLNCLESGGAFHILDVEKLLTHDALVQEITVKKSRFSHHEYGVGLFATKTAGKNKVVGYYYGSLVYENVTKLRHETNTYGGT